MIRHKEWRRDKEKTRGGYRREGSLIGERSNGKGQKRLRKKEGGDAKEGEGRD